MIDKRRICLGKITGLFGVKGWLKVFSYTDPRENILQYSPWLLVKNNELKEMRLVDGKRQGKNVIARLQDIEDADAAMIYCGWEIFIDYSQLPAPQENEYYWADLVGLRVETVSGVFLGEVSQLFETGGANDVLVLSGERERLIPFLQGQTIINIDLEKGTMTVDWDPEF